MKAPAKTQPSWAAILWPVICEFSFAIKDRDYRKARRVGHLLQLICSNEGQSPQAIATMKSYIRLNFGGIHRGIWN